MSRYVLLTEMWWPHPVHGRIEVETDAREQLLVFRCACGQTIGVPMFAALDLNLVVS